MKVTVTTTPQRFGTSGAEQMIVTNTGEEVVYVARTAEAATAEEGLPVQPEGILTADGPLFASVEAGEGELRVLLPG